MAHELGNRQRIAAAFEQVLTEAMPEIVSRVANAEMFLKPSEAATNRIRGPRVAILVAEDRAFRVRRNALLDDRLGGWREPDDAPTFLAFGLFGWKEDAMIFEIDMPCFNLLGFLRSASRLP